MDVAPLDKVFLDGIAEELGTVEESEKNIQALSQVFRYYSKHARQLSEVLLEWASQCFPWELIHAMHLIDDILLMDNSGCYKAELAGRIQAVTVQAFQKVPSDREKREVARIVHAWQELKVFDIAVLDKIRKAIQGLGEAASNILSAAAAGEEDDDVPADAGKSAETAASAQQKASEPPAKKTKLGEAPAAAAAPPPPPRPGASVPGAGATAAAAAAAAPGPAAASAGWPSDVPKPPQEKGKAVAVIQRILSVPVERGFEMLGLQEEGIEGHDIRKAYRRLALLIHPDKNPGLESECQEALIRLQQGRVQAESDLQRMDSGTKATRGETRSDASCAAANATVDASYKCRHPGCDLPPCKQCANQCCTRNITHCHTAARLKKGMQCYFHPPPRAWARNA